MREGRTPAKGGGSLETRGVSNTGVGVFVALIRGNWKQLVYELKEWGEFGRMVENERKSLIFTNEVSF